MDLTLVLLYRIKSEVTKEKVEGIVQKFYFQTCLDEGCARGVEYYLSDM